MNTKEELFDLIDELTDRVEEVYFKVDNCESLKLEEWNDLNNMIFNIFHKIDQIKSKIHTI